MLYPRSKPPSLTIVHRDGEAAKSAAFQETPELAALELYEPVIVAAELAVNVRGKAVAELFPDKAVSGFSHQQIASL